MNIPIVIYTIKSLSNYRLEGLIIMAESRGFEPLAAHHRKRFPTVHHRPLGQLSVLMKKVHLYLLAERVGFEPTWQLITAKTISSRPPSTTRPPLQSEEFNARIIPYHCFSVKSLNVVFTLLRKEFTENFRTFCF